MAYFEDLTAYRYIDDDARAGTRNVGWLGSAHAFERADPSDETLDRLWRFCKISVAQTRGMHDCEFCRDESHFVTRGDETLLLGSAEIRVFSRSGEIYAAPTLIYHYVKSHHYRPPDEFLRALKEGPAPESQDYFDRLNELGLKWRRTSAPASKPVRFRLRPD
jgi:hypothetical protein